MRSGISRVKLTPPQVAQQWGVNVSRILGFIKTGELRAVNIATNPNGRRPRYLIDPADLAAFEDRRANRTADAASPKPRRSRRRTDAGVKEYF